MRVCPNCQAPNPPAARFCRSCGEACAPDNPAATAAESAPPREGPSDPEAADLGFATITSKISLADTLSKPSQPLVAPCLAEPAPAPPPVVERTDEEAAAPLRVWLNFSHVLIAGHSTTFEMRLENTAAAPLDHIAIRMESRGLKEAIAKSIHRLGTRQESHPVTLEIDPMRPGRNLLRCTVRLRVGGQDRSYVGERDIAINNLPENPQNLSINIHDIMSNGGGGGANANLGAEYGDVHIGNLLGSGMLRSLNDLINLELPERFQPLTLALDYEISERAPAPQPSGGLAEPFAARAIADGDRHRPARPLTIPAAFVGCSQQGSLLRLTPGPAANPATPVLLVARGEFRLGRSRPEVDFVTWFLPRTPANDAKTKGLSRRHLVLTAQGDRLLAGVPYHGTGDTLPHATIDGQKISPGQPLVLGGRAALGLGKEYFLDVTPFTASEQTGPPIANLALWSGPADSNMLGCGGCVRLLPLGCEESLWQAVWMFSEAAFGSSRCNPVILPTSGLEEIQGRFFYHRQSFWLEKSVAGGTVEINGTALHTHEIVPLVTGQSIRLGEILYRAEVEK
jgi:hypothetical protein